MERAIGKQIIGGLFRTRDHPGSSSGPPPSTTQERQSQSKSPAPRKRRSRWRTLAITFLLIVGLLTCIRPMLPRAVRWYVNRTLDRNLLYEGASATSRCICGAGAYSISDIRIIKKSGNVPTPFFQAKSLELAVQWDGVLHRKVVGQVVMDHPELNFVDASDDSESQTAPGVHG